VHDLTAVDIMCLHLHIIVFLNFRSICAVNLGLHCVGAAEGGSDQGRIYTRLRVVKMWI